MIRLFLASLLLLASLVLLTQMLLMAYAVGNIPAVTNYEFAGDPVVSVAPSLVGVLKNQTVYIDYNIYFFSNYRTTTIRLIIYSAIGFYIIGPLTW
jgi:hypothetical protein